MKSDAKNIGPSIKKGTFILFHFQKHHFEETLMIQNHLSALREKHQALERKIEEEETRPLPDTIRIHSLKKEKLRLKEELLD